MGMCSQVYSTDQAEVGFVDTLGSGACFWMKKYVFRKKRVTIGELHFAMDRPSLVLSLELER